MHEFNQLLKLRNENVDGIGPWSWLKEDDGAWTGPKHDWEKYHKENIQKLVKNWDVCIQAGGNQGMYAKLLSFMFKKVYTFEPECYNFHTLNANCQRENIFKYQAALGDHNGLCKMRLGSKQNTGTHKVEAGFDALMMKIDSFEFPVVDLILLDIEGYEINAIRGALETIERCKPVISCERSSDEIYNLIKPFGYGEGIKSSMDTFYAVQ